MAAMTLAVMTRATRGHTGRPLQADRATVLIYILVHLGALLRVIAPLLPFDYMLVVAVAGGLWAAAFLLFLLVYGPMALRPAPEAGVLHPLGRPGRDPSRFAATISVSYTTIATIPVTLL